MLFSFVRILLPLEWQMFNELLICFPFILFRLLLLLLFFFVSLQNYSFILFAGFQLHICADNLAEIRNLESSRGTAAPQTRTRDSWVVRNVVIFSQVVEIKGSDIVISDTHVCTVYRSVIVKESNNMYFLFKLTKIISSVCNNNVYVYLSNRGLSSHYEKMVNSGW